MTDVDVCIRRVGVPATRNVELVRRWLYSSTGLLFFNILICVIGSTTGAQEKCLDRCGCNMGLEGWSSSAKQCEDGKFSNTNQCTMCCESIQGMAFFAKSPFRLRDKGRRKMY